MPLSILNGKLYIAQPHACFAWFVNMVMRFVYAWLAKGLKSATRPSMDCGIMMCVYL